MCTIPVAQSLEPRLEALPYEQVEELVKAHERYAVALCICRRQARLRGEGCGAPEEFCLIFGEFADYYVRGGSKVPPCEEASVGVSSSSSVNARLTG